MYIRIASDCAVALRVWGPGRMTGIYIDTQAWGHVACLDNTGLPEPRQVGQAAGWLHVSLYSCVWTMEYDMTSHPWSRMR